MYLAFSRQRAQAHRAGAVGLMGTGRSGHTGRGGGAFTLYDVDAAGLGRTSRLSSGHSGERGRCAFVASLPVLVAGLEKPGLRVRTGLPQLYARPSNTPI